MPRQEEEYEEWMRVPEGEGEELPEGGPPAPWMMPGREAEVPTAGKVFYVNGYTMMELTTGIRVIEPPYQENLRHRVIGRVEPGLMIGADIVPLPFAAIPVRWEDRAKATSVADYIEGVGRKIGLSFMNIDREETFPEHPDPVIRKMEERYGPFRHPKLSYVNAYVVNRLYGGSHEGGWWYNAGEPIASFPVVKGRHKQRKMWNAEDYLRMTVGWHSRYGLESVLGADVFEISRQDHFAESYPRERPAYE